MASTIPHRSIVALKLPTSVPGLIKMGRSIVSAMTGNAHFPTPSPALATVSAALDALTAAESEAATRAKGAVEARNTQRIAAISDLHALKGYVQETSDAQPAMAEEIITSAGMSVKKPPVRSKTDFAVKQGDVSGSVHLVARAAARRASYEWMSSADGGKTWVTAPATLQAKTAISGLTVGTSYQFKFRPVTRTGEGDWSQVVTFLVN